MVPTYLTAACINMVSDQVMLVTFSHFHNILRFLDILPNFPFTTSEKIRDYHLHTWHIPVTLRVAKLLKT